MVRCPLPAWQQWGRRRWWCGVMYVPCCFWVVGGVRTVQGSWGKGSQVESSKPTAHTHPHCTCLCSRCATFPFSKVVTLLSVKLWGWVGGGVTCRGSYREHMQSCPGSLLVSQCIHWTHMEEGAWSASYWTENWLNMHSEDTGNLSK